MEQGALTLDEEHIVVIPMLEYHLFDRTGGEVYPDCIQRDTLSGDSDPDLAGSQKPGTETFGPCSPVHFQRGGHFAVRHIRSNEKDRKSTRLNSSHANISYAVFCLKKKTRAHTKPQTQ